MAQRLRVAVLVGDFGVGGGQIAAFRLAASLSKKHDVFLVNARPWIKSDFVDSDWPSVSLIDTSGSERDTLAPQLADKFLELKIDLIHSHIWWADRLAIQIKELIDLPWVTTLHGCQEFLFSAPSSDPQFWPFVREFYQKINGIAYLSAKNLVGARTLGLLPFVPVKQIYNCLPNDPAQPKQAEKNPPVIKFVLASRAIAEKGWDTALEALALVEKTRPGQSQLLLVGDGPFYDTARAQASKLGLAEKVTFTGHEPNPMKIMRECHVGLLPSRFTSESLPNSVVEYLASGLPVIGSERGEIANMIERGPIPAGVILPKVDGIQLAHDLAAAMIEYIDKPALRELHAENASMRYRALFSEEKASSAYTALYYSTIGSCSGASRRAIAENLPRFSQDVEAITESEPDISILLPEGKRIEILPLDKQLSERIPTDDNYVQGEFVYFDKHTGSVVIQPHPLGPVWASIGSFEHVALGASTAKVKLKFVGAREINIAHVCATLAIAENDRIDLNRLESLEGKVEVLLQEKDSIEVELALPGYERWHLICGIQMKNNDLAAYSAVSITSIVTVESHKDSN
ncbi:glycosyltransferase family 4 protein [Ensifer sp. Root127]|uniref:glycosyltransferase family 4 protein n=1 Tax=Ensifer sp. Root127 TaxID=1736440 RepID=UPI000709F9CA|nr:glycosyltransferase family 4 protein [Ensifer sp. Root127]KQW61015.1 hypothetical protein ASD03_36740 [Ensifer sp. Root127]